MIAVTLFCVIAGGYVGHQLNIIRQRHQEAARYKVSASYIIVTNVGRVVGEHRPDAPWPLGWLGEVGLSGIWVPLATSDEKIDQLKRLFPEAEIVRLRR